MVFSKDTPSNIIKEETLKLDFIGHKKDEANVTNPLDLFIPDPKGNLSEEFLCMG